MYSVFRLEYQDFQIILGGCPQTGILDYDSSSLQTSVENIFRLLPEERAYRTGRLCRNLANRVAVGDSERQQHHYDADQPGISRMEFTGGDRGGDARRPDVFYADGVLFDHHRFHCDDCRPVPRRERSGRVCAGGVERFLFRRDGCRLADVRASGGRKLDHHAQRPLRRDCPV